VKRLLVATLALAACETPADGVLSIAFLLEPPPALETRQVPPASATGVPPLQWGQAGGRCDCDVPARSVRCTFEGLPPTSAAGQPLTYELAFLLWYAPLPTGFDARTIDRDPGGRDPDLPPPPMVPPLPRAPAGPIAPDPFGKADRTLTMPPFEIDRIAGAELKVVTASAAYIVIDGRVGNLPDATTPPASAPTPSPGGGHVH
jgi:hypothetical protein